MSELIIKGGNVLKGKVSVQGAKNSALPILAATVLCRGKCEIHNCPGLTDVEAAIKILKTLGCECSRSSDSLTVDPSGVNAYEIPEELMREMRSSVVFLGAVISRTGSAVICSPGGCELGPRPIDLHISALKKLGVRIEERNGCIYCTAPLGIIGAEISLIFPSVGATENIILAAAVSKGRTVIYNAAKEPEISDLADFLNSCGARIRGAGSDTVVIEGVSSLYGTSHNVIPDRIAAATYMSAVTVTKGWAVLENTMAAHMTSVIDFFRNVGCEIKAFGNNLEITAPSKIKAFGNIRTCVYPGFPTDAGPLIVPVLALADGVSVFEETIFENRFKYINELNRLGAKINIHGKCAFINGNAHLCGATVRCTDLRGGASLVTAALAASGETRISEIHHIDRGYCGLYKNLCSLGADVERTDYIDR